MPDAATRPDHFRRVENAVVVPPDTPRMRQRAGVLAADGSYVEEAQTVRNNVTLTARPAMPSAVKEHLAGQWLWCGTLFDHFGHFLIESTARLWAAHLLETPPAGLLFIPKRPRRGSDLTGFQRQLIRAWGLDLPVCLALRATRVECLVVPEQALGLGRRIAGTPDMRSVTQRHFGAEIAANGPERLYVSRSGLPPAEGAILTEPELEDALRSEGYAIFHPQNHDIATQIARYKAARQIVVADGSAGHLLAYVAGAHQRIAYLPRRTEWLEGPVAHIAAFAGRPPVMLPKPTRIWRHPDRRRYRNTTYCVHDLEAIGDALREVGMIGAAAAFHGPADADRFAPALPAGFVEAPV